MTRTLQEQLIKNGLANKPIKKRRQKNKLKNSQEQLSKRDLEELMGIRRPTYQRKNGVIRQK